MLNFPTHISIMSKLEEGEHFQDRPGNYRWIRSWSGWWDAKTFFFFFFPPKVEEIVGFKLFKEIFYIWCSLGRKLYPGSLWRVQYRCFKKLLWSCLNRAHRIYTWLFICSTAVVVTVPITLTEHIFPSISSSCYQKDSCALCYFTHAFITINNTFTYKLWSSSNGF